jgi:hypothetical protein
LAKKKKRVINLDRLRATDKVRYGRANLTVERMVSVHATPVEQALKAHRQGRTGAEDVAWAFVKEQVTAHTPSFDWGDADLDRLLPRIVAVAKEPKLKARTPADLVPELEQLEAKERERWKKLNEQIRKSILPTIPKLGPTIPKLGPTLPKFGPAISEDLLKSIGKVPKLPIPDALQNSILETNKQIAEGLKTNQHYEAMLKSVQPDLKVFESLRLDLERITQMVRPQIPALGIDVDALSKIAGFGPGSDWQKLMEQIAEAARQEDVPEVADAVEATANESALKPFEIDLSPVVERVKELLDQLKSLAPEDSMARAVIIAVAADLIVRYIEHLLGGK